MDQETATHSERFRVVKKHENLLKKKCFSIWSGNKETEESKHEKEEVMKTISVSKIVKEKASETETDEPKNTDDAKIIFTDVTLEKGKEDETTQKPEEVLLFLSSSLKLDAQESKYFVLFCAGKCWKSGDRRRSNRNQELKRTREGHL